MKYTLTLLACGVALTAWGQQLNPKIMGPEDRGKRDFNVDYLEAPKSDWSVELALGVSPWSVFNIPNGETIMNSSLESFYDLSASEMSITMDRLRFNTNVINQWDNRSYGSSGERVNTFRIRFWPSDKTPISFSFGAGKAVGVFLAQSELVEGANSVTKTIGLNHSQAISYAALDSYFHLESIYGQWIPVDIEIPDQWVSNFYEFGVGYQILPKCNVYICYTPMFLSKNNLESWFDGILAQAHSPSLSPLENITIADHVVMGGQCTFGHFMLGLERRWTYFTQNTASYYALGARPIEEQSSWAINLGYHF